MKNEISRFSHSEIGSAHWFNTLVGNTLHIGEYLHKYGSSGITEDILSKWGDELYERSKELLLWYEKCGTPDKQRLTQQLEEALKVLKLDI